MSTVIVGERGQITIPKEMRKRLGIAPKTPVLVEIRDEGDRYVLVFDPCGSGGAIRRCGLPGLAVLKEAAPETWLRSNEVPMYCAHCAMNELTSIRRLGYPAWVTEFDPDPARPCGWAVYKDRSAIPDRYFARLGAKRP